MCQLLETIRVRKNIPENIDFHSARVNSSRKELYRASELWDLAKMIEVPDLDPAITYRCRFLYSKEVDHIEFLPYIPRVIEKLYLVKADVDYAFKYADRKVLEDLKKEVTLEPNADILIIRDGLVTDTSFSNIAFYDGMRWITPASPLLKGTKRAYYLQKGYIREEIIEAADIFKFSGARLMNSMLDLESGTDILNFEDIFGRSHFS